MIAQPQVDTITAVTSTPHWCLVCLLSSFLDLPCPLWCAFLNYWWRCHFSSCWDCQVPWWSWVGCMAILLEVSLVLSFSPFSYVMPRQFGVGEVSWYQSILNSLRYYDPLNFCAHSCTRIPFASVNLLTACTAIRKNLFAVIVAYFFIALALAWSLLWAVALAGVANKVVVESDVPM